MMNTETLEVHTKGDDFEIVVQHEQTGSAYGITLSKDAYEQLRLHFVVGQSEQFLAFTDWYFSEDKELIESLRSEFEYWLKNKGK